MCVSGKRNNVLSYGYFHWRGRKGLLPLWLFPLVLVLAENEEPRLARVTLRVFRSNRGICHFSLSFMVLCLTWTTKLLSIKFMYAGTFLPRVRG